MRQLSIFILLFSIHYAIHCQNDLPFYIYQAKANSPLIQDNKNQSEVNKIEIERIKALYTKPQITFNSGIAVAPIINRDNGTSQLQISPGDATNYFGYDIAASNGGIYQGMLNINQPLFNSGKLKMASEQALVANQINQNNIKLSEHDIEKIVGDQYILCLQDIKQTDYMTENQQHAFVRDFFMHNLI